MLNSLFSGLFSDTSISVSQFVLCLCIALLIGLWFTFVYCFKSRYTQSFVITLALLPAVVTVVILMVNGNIGAGVAVAGAFSLVRFRSLPGTAKEIGTLFLAMGAGLICGMGYLGYALLYSLILGCCMILFTAAGLGSLKKPRRDKVLRVTIPEDLDYTDIFTDLLNEYTVSHQLVSVKTTNMGSMFKLTYRIELKDASKEKQMIDQLRTRNGNLEISLSNQEDTAYEL